MQRWVDAQANELLPNQRGLTHQVAVDTLTQADFQQGCSILPIDDRKKFEDALNSFLITHPPPSDVKSYTIDKRKIDLYELHQETLLYGSGTSVSDDLLI